MKIKSDLDIRMSKRTKHDTSSDDDSDNSNEDNSEQENENNSDEETPKMSYDEWYSQFLEALDIISSENFSRIPYDSFNHTLHRLVNDIRDWESKNPMPY